MDTLGHIQELLRAGRGDAARTVAERLTREEPGNAQAWFLLGAALLALGRPVLALDPLRRSHALTRDNPAVTAHLYRALLQAGRRLESQSQHSGAEAVYREALALDPEAAPARICLGQLLSADGRYAEAREHLQAVLARQPGQADACAALALSYEFEGQYAQAEAILRQPLAERPVAAVVALAYAAVARQIGAESAATALLEEALTAPPAPPVRCDIHFALGRLYDSLGEYERAFEHYRLGNRLLNYRYDSEQTRRTFDAVITAFSAARHAQLPRSGNCAAQPVFIVGMPRSGTTLVEQILSSHPDVCGAGERDDIARIVHALGGPAPAPAVLERLTATDLGRAAQGYLDTLTRLAPAATRITDKMPHNFLALGYIDLLFPNCRIVQCVRDPRDTCLSIWFQQMTGNHPYTNDLDALADYYRQYERLMAHWKGILRAPILEVLYEDLVNDLEQGARTLIEFCGLPWDDRCLRFHENTRIVTTPTYGDVRRPVHDKSVGRWRHYQAHLRAVAELVGPAG